MNEHCPEIEELLSGWADGELNTADESRVEAHLAECAECRAIADVYVEHDSAIGGARPVRTDAEWEALASRVEAAIEADVAADRRTQTAQAPARAADGGFRMPRWLFRPALGTAAAALIVALFYPWTTDEPTRSAEGPVPARRVAESEAKAPEPLKQPGTLGSVVDEVSVRNERKDAPVEADVLAGSLADRDFARGAALPTPAAAPVERARVRASDVAGPAVDALAPGRTREVADLKEQKADTPRPDVTPGRPANGAGSLEELLAWWQTVGEPNETSFGEPSSGAIKTLSADRGQSARREVASSLEESFVSETARVLAWGRAQLAGRDTSAARTAFARLTGDWPGNDSRADAWQELLALETAEALGSANLTVVVSAARSHDGYRAEFPNRLEAAADRARVWVHLARLDSRWCAAAAARAAQEASGAEEARPIWTELANVCR